MASIIHRITSGYKQLNAQDWTTERKKRCEELQLTALSKENMFWA